MKKLIATLFLILGLATYGFAQSSSQRSLVSVVGEAEMSITPNQVLLTLEVITLDKDLGVAKKANDDSVLKTLTVIRSHQIASQDVQTINFTITPKYTTPIAPKKERIFIGYEITKRILITLREINKIESFLGNVLISGVNRVVDIEFSNSEIRKYTEQVRAMAVKNSQEKARLYAQQLGQNIGRAYSITEEGAEGVSYGNGNGNGDGIGDYTEENQSRITGQNLVSSQVTFAIGQIKIEERIIVSFLLE